MPRATADVDVLSVVPHTDVQAVLNLAGKGSPLHDQYRLYLDLVTVATYPDSFEDRLMEVFAGAFQHLQIMALDPYDLALSKLERNAPHDREDVFYLADTVPFDLAALDARYRQEMRPYLGVPDHRIAVSPRLKSDYENGKSYYPFDGRQLVVRPDGGTDQPDANCLAWHNTHVFLS